MRYGLLVVMLLVSGATFAHEKITHVCLEIETGRYALDRWSGQSRERLTVITGPQVNDRGESLSAFQHCLELANSLNLNQFLEP